MEPITKEEIHLYYMENKEKFKNKVELIKAFMSDKLKISFENVKQQFETSVYDEIMKLEGKLKWIIQDVKNTKKKHQLHQSYFMTADECNLFMKIYQESTVTQHIPASDDPNQNRISNFQPFKHFSELTTQKQRINRTKDILEMLNDWADREDFELVRLLGFIGYSHTYNKNKKLASVFKSIWNGDEIELKNEVPLETAIYLKEKTLISKRHYTDIRLTLKPYVVLPTYNDVARHIHDIMPELRSLNDGIMANVIDVARNTVIRLQDEIVENMETKIKKDCNTVFKANFNAGIDGCGGFAIHNNKSFLTSSANTSHLVTVAMSLTSIEIEDDSRTSVFVADKVCAFQNQR